jgi:hypothetical protein
MRLHVASMLAAVSLATASVAQTQDNNIPREIGNRANGFSYQPTPSEVIPREKQAGIRPSAAQQKAADAEVDRLYNDLMRDYRPGQNPPQK